MTVPKTIDRPPVHRLSQLTRRLRPLSIRTRLTVWYTSILLAILVVISGLSYSALAWSLRQDLDASLLTVGQIIRDTGYASGDTEPSPGPEAALRRILGPEFYDKFFRLIDPEGRLGAHSPHVHEELWLSPRARDNALRGRPTFETIRTENRLHVRLLTLPVMNEGRLAQIVQVGIGLERTDAALSRYLQTLVVLIPLGVGLAAVGGAVIARVALAPVDEMSMTARRITGEDLSERLPRRAADDELDHLAETLNAMLERLDDAFAQMRRFTADAAHELRTPLTALKGGIEVALRSTRSADEYRDVLVSSLEEVDRLIRLAEDLLLYSRSTAGLEVPRLPVDLEPIVLEVLDVGTRLAHPKSVIVKVGTMAPAGVLGEPLALRRALLNIVENAIKYAPEGGQVEVSLTRDDRAAIVNVDDTGPGVAPAEVDKIFQPFVRLDAARDRETGGAGLGLAITQAIVAAHGGTLGVDRAPIGGARFTIRLPLA